MKTTAPLVRPGVFLLLLLSLTGCVSTKYKAAPKDSPPAVPLNLAAGTPEASALLHSVVVYKGPGSWKKEAYWDEYIITFANRMDTPLTLETAMLFDLDETAQLPGGDPWKLEALSREKIKKFEKDGRTFLLGAGLGALWVGSAGVGAAALMGGSALGVAASGAVLIGLPVLGIGTWVRSVSAKGDIKEEFQRRRMPLPAILPAHGAKSGSLFFPISPGPKRLALRYRAGGRPAGVTIDLATLAGLHLQPDTPRKP